VSRLCLSAAAMALGTSCASGALQSAAGRTARVGILGRAPANPRQVAFEVGLQQVGWIKGQNLLLEFRDHEGRTELLQPFAAELVRQQVDLIVAPTAPEALAASGATSAIPIVFATIADPVGIGLVASLARPGGNVTGLSTQSSQLVPKRLELLTGLLPNLTRLAAVRDGRNPSSALGHGELERLGALSGIQVDTYDVRSRADLEAALSLVAASGAEALLFGSEALFLSQLLHPILEAVAAIGRPAFYAAREFVDAGGLMAHGPTMNALNHRAAAYVDRILRGATPSELPVEQATTFDFIVNTGVAQRLGLSFPPEVAAQVTEWAVSGDNGIDGARLLP
jgi:putative ABC transport system substrate-binding protein